MAKGETSKGARKCDRCKTQAAVFQMHGLNLCRRCFREMAPKMDFKKHE